MEQNVKQLSTFSLVESNIVYFSLIQSNEIDGANYEMDGVKYEIDGVNHVKQSSTLQSSQVKCSLFQSNETDGANYKMDGVKYEIDGVNNEIDGENHLKIPRFQGLFIL